MFVGTHRVRVDEKGRLAIPAQFRKQLTEGSYISIGPDNVLTIYPPEQWQALSDRLTSPLPSADTRALSRALTPKAGFAPTRAMNARKCAACPAPMTRLHEPCATRNDARRSGR